ncbi:asparagine synthase (glutamine-hydrolyzing) [Salinibacter altiplanensis]|uniref:asparagine synthase (glutamine-hydrolyzing) n=1 Tax=Salinibacter altiplanensis TaxID=1803181 RepID=UPI000C9FCC8B|nr:asparagine synthase (glutamine-hydrolyzing) [Salinibacter altiplanensis]
MCGIAATFCYGEGQVDRDALLRARDCMRARGPDASGYWERDDQRVALAHRRLSIIDLSERGAQPMADEKRGLRVVYNGEIYNYRPLREELRSKGYEFQSDTDTEVLLYLYAEHGRDLTERLRGMYAFALYDEQERGLLMARDPYGIKPLYYADDGSALHVASQVQALREHESTDTTANPAGHVGFFLWGHVPEPHTLYRGIQALPAGHTCWISEAGGVEEPRPFETIPGALRRVEANANGRSPQTALRDALLDSVEHHLIADVDVGLFLSAGLDSATLTALAAEVHDRVKTVTLGFEEFRDTPEDEAPGAERIAERYDTNHETVWVTQQDFAAAHDDLLGAMDQPTIDGVNSYFVSRAARKAGLKVALSGLGGDELFGGYPSFSQIPRLVSTVGALPGAATIGKGFRAVAAPIIERFTSPKYAGLLEYSDDYAGAYLLRRGLYMPWELPEMLDPDLVRAGWEQLQPMARLRETIDDISDEHLRVTALESSWYMRNQLLRDTDWASMAHSLEVRTPLVDRTLLGRIAPLIARHGLSKQDMARTPKQPLPDDLLNRPKSGFTVPVRKWLLADRPEYESARGLRGWAQYIYNRHT